MFWTDNSNALLLPALLALMLESYSFFAFSRDGGFLLSQWVYYVRYNPQTRTSPRHMTVVASENVQLTLLALGFCSQDR